jgi:ABC-type Fe3+ transport system permease subunit
VVLRAFISNWGVGVSLWDELSLNTFRTIWAQPNLLRAIVNSMAIGVIGGALAVVCYLFVGIAMHRKPDNTTRFWTTACWCRAPCRACWRVWRSCGCSCSCRCGWITR